MTSHSYHNHIINGKLPSTFLYNFFNEQPLKSKIHFQSYFGGLLPEMTSPEVNIFSTQTHTHTNTPTGRDLFSKNQSIKQASK